MNIILLGPPGAGKTTQGRLLSEKLNIPWISMGEILRQAYKSKQPEGIEWWKKYGSKGLNAPISLKFGLLLQELIKARQGFILDDFPRSKEDLDAFDGYLKWSKLKITRAILLAVPENVSVKRVLTRYQGDRKSGVSRYDDSPYVLRVRIKEGYKKDIKRILAYFKRNKLLTIVEGDKGKTVEQVNSEILHLLV